MPLFLTPTESFLADFHDRRPGVTSHAFMSLRATKSGEVAASSYHHLASLVPDGNESLSVLDVACGDGYLLWLISSAQRQATTLVGIDISEGELNAARLRLGQRATLVRARAQAIPLLESSVDYVLCHMALMLMDDLDTAIQQIRRVLKLGGVFSFVVGAKPPSSAALNLYLARLRETRELLGSTMPAFGDRRLANPESIQHLLSSQFSGVTIDEISIVRRYTPSELWTWFEGMYDLDGIPPQEQSIMRAGYIEDIFPLREADGCIEFTDYLRLVRAIAA